MNKENEEIKRLTLENEGLANRIEEKAEKIQELDERVRDLEGKLERLEIELEGLYDQDTPEMFLLARAVHEMQQDLLKLHPELIINNLVYAPNKVGM
tara:strand:+ start:6123 stop:6413 length:291 start_codon:yes stop_codon:yes gene_type:complete